MRQQTIRVADRGYVVIPAKIRRRLKMTKGTRLLLTESEDSLTIPREVRVALGLKTVKGGLLPGVDINDRDSLYERMEGRS